MNFQGSCEYFAPNFQEKFVWIPIISTYKCQGNTSIAFPQKYIFNREEIWQRWHNYTVFFLSTAVQTRQRLRKTALILPRMHREFNLRSNILKLSNQSRFPSNYKIKTKNFARDEDISGQSPGNVHFLELLGLMLTQRFLCVFKLGYFTNYKVPNKLRVNVS